MRRIINMLKFRQAHYIDSIILVNDKGGSISPSGTDQFPPLMSCERWVILWLESRAVSTEYNETCQSNLTVTTELERGVISGMKIWIPLESST